MRATSEHRLYRLRLEELPNPERAAFATDAALLDPAIGHVVDAVGGHVVDDHAADVELLEGAPGMAQIVGEDPCLQAEAAGVDLGESLLDLIEWEGYDQRREGLRWAIEDMTELRLMVMTKQG